MTGHPATPEQRRWLLLISCVPAEPSSARGAVWRAARRRSAVSPRHAHFLLPPTPNARAAYERFTWRIKEYGGEAPGEIERCVGACESFAQNVYTRQGNGQ